MADIPCARIVHSTGSRIRFRLPEMKGNQEYFNKVRRQFDELDFVERVEINPVTGSVLLLLHRGESEKLTEFVREKQLFSIKYEEEVISSQKKRKSIRDCLYDGLSKANGKTRDLTGGALDLADITVIFLLSSSVYQIAKGNIGLPQWHTGLWYAVNTLIAAKR